MAMGERIIRRQSEPLQVGLNFAKVALLGIGLWKVSQLAISFNDLIGILGRKDPKVTRSLQDAIASDPTHLGKILSALNPEDLDYQTASSVADQVCYAFSRGKGKPHDLLIRLLGRASSENQINLDE